MTKRIITLLLAVAMLLSMCALAGCGEKGTGKGNGPANITSSEEEYFLDMPSELRGTTVKFATWIDHSRTDTATCLAGFEETTGMKYEMVQVNQEDYITKLISLIASGQSPDVVVENGDFPKTLKVLMPLEEETTGLDVTDPFWNQGLVETFTIGDYCYLVNGAKSTWDLASGMTYYNKTMLEENGIATPQDLIDQDNWTVDSMWTLMQQIKSTCGLPGRGTAICVDVWLNMYGGNQVKWDSEADTFKTALKDDATKKALEYIVKAQDAGLAVGVDHHDEKFTEGKQALHIAGAYGLRKNPGWFYNMPLDDLGFAVLPKLNKDDADYPYMYQIRAYGICKGAKNPKGAAYFLRYFLNEDHYNVDQIFKNEEAKNLYLTLREKADPTKASMSHGVAKVTNPVAQVNEIIGYVLAGTASQVSVNLETSFNRCEAYVEAANEMVQEVLMEQ